MNNNTVNYGIDLGTTNSAIARMTIKGAEIIPVKRQNYIPSVVAVNKRSDIKVGDDALRSDLTPVGRWFKRLMGTNNTLELADGSRWSPERLSAEILKALKAATKLKTNEDVVDVVITIPAMFNQPQCAATQEASELAGLNAVVLLQEPIAAATAYLAEDAKEGYYLVYDLGGGTFDVSLIRLKDGEMTVVEHGGDNYLGGADFDRAVFDWVLNQIDRKGGDVSQFEETTERYKLFQLCEEARIELSESHVSSRTIDIGDFDTPIASVELTTERLNDLIEDFVTKTIDIAKDRLNGHKLSSSRVEAILLVGGPTQMPYIRERLQKELGIRVNTDQDPMTVVARGAAIHAGTLLKKHKKEQAQVGTASIALFYEPVTPDSVSSIAGKVETPENFKGEVRVSSASGDWETGWQPIINGSFQVDVEMGRDQVREFVLELRDLKGTLTPCSPAAFYMRKGVKTAQPVTGYQYGVVLEGGQRVGVIVEAGTPLPAHGFATFRFAKTLVAGSPESILIYFVEGNSPRADENMRVGELIIRGSEISRTIAEGQPIEIRVRMDESRLLTAKVYIPLIDEEYALTLRRTSDAPDVGDLSNAIGEMVRAIGEIEDLVEEEEEQAKLLRASSEVEKLEALLERVQKGEVGEAERVHKLLSDAKSSVRPLRDKYGLRAKHEKVVTFLGEAEELCLQFNDAMGVARLRDLRSDADKCLRLEDEKELDAVHTRVREIFWQHYGKTPECWQFQVQWMRKDAPDAHDPITAYEIVRRAEQSLSEDDFEGVSLQVSKFLQLMPDRKNSNNRFYDAGLR